MVDSKWMLATGFIGFVLGMMASVFLMSEADGKYTLAKKLIGECAVGQDMKLRETSGTATYVVTFKDGNWDSVACSSSPAK